MKSFFEEYGRVIVTVLIILGIILVGYTIAGNGRNSAFGRFTTATVDSLTGQASSLLKDSASFIEKKTSMSSVIMTDDKKANAVIAESNGTKNINLTGETSKWWDSKSFSSQIRSGMNTPWGKKTVMSFDIMADKDASINIDFNAEIDGVPGNDNYTHNSMVSVDGKETVYSGTRADISLSGNKWHHIIIILENGNETDNPKHLDMISSCSILYVQKSGTTNYKLKNVKCGVTD